MMHKAEQRAICLYFKESLKPQTQLVFTDFFHGLLGANCQIVFHPQSLTVIFTAEYDTDFSEIAMVINSDMYTSCRLFASSILAKDLDVDAYLAYLSTLGEDFFKISQLFFTEDDLVILNIANELVAQNILKKYYLDQEMLALLRAYLDSNMNISRTASLVYMHRNTVMNKIDRFIEETGYNIKEFKKAFVIYHLLIKTCA